MSYCPHDVKQQSLTHSTKPILTMLGRRCIQLQFGEIAVSSEQISDIFMKIKQDCHKNDGRREI